MENKNNEESLSKILKDLSEIKLALEEKNGMGDWITRKQAMLFLGYADTAMAELEKSKAIEFSQVGRRKFIRKSEIISLLEKNIQK